MSSNQSPNASTFDAATPHRPGLADGNGCAKVDDENEPPDPQTMPNAAEWNTIWRTLIAIGQMIPIARFYVQTSTLFDAVSVSTQLTFGDFTFTHLGVGQYQITWPAGKLPPSSGKPIATLNVDGGAANRGMIQADSVTNGVQVWTWNAAGVAADLDFQVLVF